MKTMKHYLGTFAAASMLLIAGAVNAALISGDVTFDGSWKAYNATVTDEVSIGEAAHIAFIGDVEVEQAIGDFDGAAGSLATYTDFTFNPFGGPITPLWTIEVDGTTFAFDLEAVTVSFQSGRQLNLIGTGTLRADGYDDTEFFWSFSGDSTGAILSFSAASFNVPEPSVVGLLGLGLIAMGATGIRRRRAARQA